MTFTDGDSVATFVKGQGVSLYCECTFLRKVPDTYKSYLKNVPVCINVSLYIENI